MSVWLANLAVQEDRQRLAKRLEAAQSCIDALQGELSALQAVHEKTQEALRGRVAEDQLQQQHLTKVCLQEVDNRNSGKEGLGSCWYCRTCRCSLNIVSQHSAKLPDARCRGSFCRCRQYFVAHDWVFIKLCSCGNTRMSCVSTVAS